MKNFTKTMRFYKSIYHFWFSLIITGFELLGTGNNCLTLESISLEVGFLRAPQFSSWVRFTTSFIMLSLMRTSLTECLWDMKEWYISNLRVRERYCRQFDGKKPHWFIFLMNPLILRIFPRFYSFYFFTSLFGNEYREVFREKIIIFHCLFYDINDKLVGEEPLKEFDTMKFISVNYLPLLIPNMENLTYWNSWRVSQYNY